MTVNFLEKLREMGGTILSKTVKDNDWGGGGVTLNANMKVSEQCRIAAW